MACPFLRDVVDEEALVLRRAFRKSFDSINVQMVCNADCVFSNVVAKWPGSVHDSRIFRASEIYQRLSQGEFSGMLLGDRGVSPVRACDITVACAVLHNMACLRKERTPRVPPAMDWDNPAIFPDDDSGQLLRDQ
ncbi:putative nuclease HARBI1 [Tachysurus ichikawai]